MNFVFILTFYLVALSILNTPQKLEILLKQKKYFKDFEKGSCYEYQVPGLTVHEIKEFAALYDPQRFHLDEDEAKKTHFGELIASGFQTQLKCFEPFCRKVLINSGAIGSPGVDSLKWVRPWYPHEQLDVKVTLVEKRLSSKRNDRGYLSFKLEAKVGESMTLIVDWVVIMLTEDGDA